MPLGPAECYRCDYRICFLGRKPKKNKDCMVKHLILDQKQKTIK